jgi:hypothetical protein
LSFLVQSTKEHLENTGGIALAAELARISGLTKLRFSVRTWNGALLSMFGLLVMGRSARETLRIYLGRMARKVKGLIAMLFSCNISLLKRVAITPIDIGRRRYIPVDVDVSTFDNGKSHKEGVGRTYMGTDGYAPIFSCIGTEGYMLDCQLKARHAAQSEGNTRVPRTQPRDDQRVGTIESRLVPARLRQRCHVEVDTWWTNLFESPETIIALYHDHGTSEQFHSELKTEMKVDELVLTISMLAFNTLRYIGQSARSLPHLLPITPVTTQRKRLRKVISDLILVGCKLVQHGRQMILRIWDGNPCLPVFNELYVEFLRL